MDLKLSNKTALVTGSTLGIGFAIAAALAAEGARVIINGRTQSRVNESLSRLKAANPKGDFKGIAADLGAAAGCESLISQCGDIDILINNVGIFEPVPFEKITDDQWLQMFEVNVMSGVRLSRAYLPRMKAKNWGRIIFISSESGLQIPAEMIHYGMTKTAQLAIARGLAETCAGANITVNSVLPGPTASEGVAGFVADLARQSGQSTESVEQEFFKTARPSSLIKRFLTPEEIAHAVTFLASPLASGTTGAAVRVEGGIVKAIG